MSEDYFLESPVGTLLLTADENALTRIHFADGNVKGSALAPKSAILRQAVAELEEYFAGKRKSFSVPVRTNGTEFQKKIWERIARVPHGATITYRELASFAGSPNATRAAGTSTGRNPIAIIIPCHRVMGSGGGLCGFAGGLDRKRFLLDLEKIAY